MSDKSFAITFSGKLVEGASRERVMANVAALFKVEVAKVERLFSGKPVVIKKGLDKATAQKYQVALKKVGAIASVVDIAALQQAKQQKPAAASRPKEETPVAPEKRKSVGLTKSVVKAAPQSLDAFSDVEIDKPGVVLVEHQEPAPPQIDTSHLDMGEAGETLVELPQAPEPQIDTGDLSVDQSGEKLVETEEPPPLDVDVSTMTMDEPGVVLVEHEEPEEPEIDTSKLSLSE
jgi:hypothetical protein